MLARGFAVSRQARFAIGALRSPPGARDRAVSRVCPAGALKANPDPKRYITDEYMKLAAAGLTR